MGKIGLVAGAGMLPLEFVRAAKGQGEKVVVFAIQGIADPGIEEAADRTYWVDIGHYKKYVFFLLKERIRQLVLLGKIKKNAIYDKERYDSEGQALMRGLRDKKDSSIFEEITARLKLIGVEVIEGTRYLSHLLPEKGVLSQTAPDARLKEDIRFGYDAAKKLAGMDIGQTVVIKDKTVVAVEAMEGTDATIERARSVAGKGCVMVKVSRPDQDFRWDIPTVGPDTITRLSENGFRALAIESGRMFLLEKQNVVERANSENMVVEVI